MSSLISTVFIFSQEIPMDLTDINPTIIESEPQGHIIERKPRSFTFDNPAMVRTNIV